MPLFLGHPGQAVSFNELQSVPCPPATESWHPIPHHRVFSIVETLAKRLNFGINDIQHFLSENKQRYLATLSLDVPDPTSEYGIIIQSSTDKSLPYRIFFGHNLRLCSNGCVFGHGIHQVRRKHTIADTELESVFESITLPALSRFSETLTAYRKRMDKYKSIELSPADASHLLVSAARKDIISSQSIIPTLNYFESPFKMTEAPSHPDGLEAPSESTSAVPSTQPGADPSLYAPGSLFCLHNAFTASFRDTPSPFRLVDRSSALSDHLASFAALQS